MKTLHTLILTGTLAAVSLNAEDAPVIKISKTDTTLSVEIGGKPFTTYNYAGADLLRPFFYPVIASDGTTVTSDQKTAGGDHPHHRSMWVAHGLVNGVDHWDWKFGGAKQRHIEFSRIDADGFEEKLEWEGKTAAPVLKETRAFRFSVLPDGSRAVDFTLTFQPTTEAVVFGETKESGLCSVRVFKSIASTSVLTNAAGIVSDTEKTEKIIWGKPANWCDISGKIDDKPYGIAIFDHPENPRHPSTWHVRHYGLMTANIFGLHDFDKTVPKGSGDFTLEKDKTVVFRYRVVIHTGDAKSAGLDEKYKSWTK